MSMLNKLNRKRKSNAGRKPLPKHMRKRYENVAVRPETKLRIQKNSKTRGQQIIDYMEEIVE